MYVYDQILDNHIIPAIGHLRLDQVEPMHIISYLETLNQDGIRKDYKNSGMFTGTIQYHHRVLKNVFTRAVEWKIIKSNPAADVKRPKVTHKEIIPYDKTEIQELLFALQIEPYHCRVMITLALTTGLHRGELLGLEWEHISMDTGIIDVFQNVSTTVAGIATVKVH